MLDQYSRKVQSDQFSAIFSFVKQYKLKNRVVQSFDSAMCTKVYGGLANLQEAPV